MIQEPINPEKLGRFTMLIDNMVNDLRNYNTLTVHQNINESYYMQKAAELRLLIEQLEDAQNKLESVQLRIAEHYRGIYWTWRKDVRWLSRHLKSSPTQ